LDLPPRKRRFTVGKVLLFGVPVALALIFGYLVMQGNWEVVRQAALFWILSHVALAGLGAALAFGHPLAVLTGAIASPFTSVMQIRGISSGTLAGLVQAKVVPPVVADFQAIKTMETGRQFWGNRVVRVLTVASLTTLGSYAGHFWFFVYIYPRVVGVA
jgi:pheromone shutdown protein TraB